MSEKYEPAFVAEGRSVTVLRGIAHAGAKIRWSDLDGKTEQTKKKLFTKLLAEGYLESAKTQADKFKENLAGQIGFGDEDTGDEPPGDEPPGDEDTGDEDTGDKFPGKPSKTSRKAGAKRK